MSCAARTHQAVLAKARQSQSQTSQSSSQSLPKSNPKPTREVQAKAKQSLQSSSNAHIQAKAKAEAKPKTQSESQPKLKRSQESNQSQNVYFVYRGRPLRSRYSRPSKLQKIAGRVSTQHAPLPKTKRGVTAGGSSNPRRRSAGDNISAILAVPSGESIRRKRRFYTASAGWCKPGREPPLRFPTHAPSGLSSAPLTEISTESAKHLFFVAHLRRGVLCGGARFRVTRAVRRGGC